MQVAAYELDEGERWPGEGFQGPSKCRPVSTVNELLTWRPRTVRPPAATDATAGSYTAVQLQSLDPCSCTTPLQLVQSHGQFCSSSLLLQCQQRPQLLVCHDMQGGYLPEEVSLSGVPGAGHYRLWHWDCIDVFVYFSHHLVTIPPKGWIHAAHTHGTKVLGTFITEFGQGRQRCNRLFCSNQSAEAVADQLVAMAVHYGFEGWLVNIENPLATDQVAVMRHFVGYLRARMRAVCQHGLVIWYDAVTVDGELRWQNRLSAANAPFFDLSDGLFLNYCWTPDTLPASVAAAGRRATDVYVGVDVHGRGCYGGGGYNSGLALEAARAAGLSAALFAPGWVYENLERSRFAELQEKWWQQIQASWQYSHAVVRSIPLNSSFNAGAGQAWFSGGKLTALQPPLLADDDEGYGGAGAAAHAATGAAGAAGWFNMLLTEALPCNRDPVSQQVISGPVVARLTASTAYNGGSSLVLCKPRQAEQQQQEQQQNSKQAAVASVVSSAQAPCCALQLLDEAVTEADCGTATPLALLQLFTADIRVVDDIALEVKCVYAMPSSSSSSGVGEAVAPRVWIMTEASTVAAAAGGQAGAGKCIHLPASSIAAAAQPQQQQQQHTRQQQLLLSSGQPSGVALQLHSDKGMCTSTRLGPLQFAEVPNGGSGVDIADGAGPAAEALCAETIWAADLSCRLSGWQWHESRIRLHLPAAQMLSGIGVAVCASGSAISDSRCEIVGVIGMLEVVKL